MNYIMIAVIKDSKQIIGFRLLNIDKWEVVNIAYVEVLEGLAFETIQIDNLGLEGEGLVGTNGNLDRYPVIREGKLFGKSPLIIVMKMVNDKFLVTNYNGERAEVTEEGAVKYSLTEGIANGKVVGNKIRSISGEYRKDRVLKSIGKGKVLAAKLEMLGNNDYTLDEEDYLVLQNKDVEDLNIGMGVLGIPKHGLSRAIRLKRVRLSATVLNLGESAFSDCINLEEVIIPEGIKIIPSRCFANCKKLKSIELPNSVQIIEANAFIGCKALKVITCGRGNIDIKFNSIPRGVMLKRR